VAVGGGLPNEVSSRHEETGSTSPSRIGGRGESFFHADAKAAS
jgi:hypothetical protein